MWQEWSDTLYMTFTDIGNGVIRFVPRVFVSIIVFIAGWIIGSVLGNLIERFFKSIDFDKFLEGLGLKDLLAHADMKLNSGRFLGECVKWFVIIVFLVAGLNILSLTQVNDFLGQVLVYLPNLIAAALMLLFGAVIANFLKKTVVASARTMGLPSSHLVGGLTKWAVWIFTILVALYQIGVASALIHTLFTGIIAAFSLAIGLAFGLGGKDTAADYLKKLRHEINE
ncbi:MAG: hypothetical protein WC764_03170 [Candidatus Paceibacterota bacterium]|jgi:hypothetical protein